MGFEAELQKTMFSVLDGNVSAGVYDDPPKRPSYPYLIIGDDSFIPFDTDDTVGRDVIASVHIWDNYDGKKRIKEVMGEVDQILNRAELSIIGYDSINCVFDSSDQFLEPDGKTRHGVLTYRLLIDEA
jgi:hypothetical protein